MQNYKIPLKGLGSIASRISCTSSHTALALLCSAVRGCRECECECERCREVCLNPFISPELTTLSTLHSTIWPSSLNRQLSLFIFSVCGAKTNHIKSLRCKMWNWPKWNFYLYSLHAFIANYSLHGCCLMVKIVWIHFELKYMLNITIYLLITELNWVLCFMVSNYTDII